MEGASVVLGSATPAVDSYYKALRGEYELLTLKKRAMQQSLPQVYTVDLREELRSGNRSIISDKLRELMEDRIRKKEQIMLFINRRGYAGFISCRSCGYVVKCPHCDVSLTEHNDGTLVCHYCGYSVELTGRCDNCGDSHLRLLGAGTQKVEEELHAAFPGREILRMDTDTVSATHSHEKLLSRFEKERIPVLVGTQMVAKGLDFENVTLVGVISADLSLYVDDYRAGERTFSLLTQVVGRAGRGAKQGRAVIQTFTPENDVIRCAARQDYDSFYEQEIELRRMRLCPPFRELFVLTASGPLESAVLRTCMRLRRSLEGWLAQPPFRDWELTVLGPAPASVAKINDRYRYRLTLAAQNTKEIRAMVAHLVRCAQTDKENKGVSVSADVNPLD